MQNDLGKLPVDSGYFHIQNSPGLEVYFSYMFMIIMYTGAVKFFFYPKENQKILNCGSQSSYKKTLNMTAYLY